MNTKNSVVVIALVIVAIGGTYFITHKKAGDTPVPTTEVVGKPINATFVSGNEQVPATFLDDSVTFYYSALGTTTLPRAISASGARYANDDESIVFWNKGNQLTLFKDNTIIFTGETEPKTNESTFSDDDFSFVYPTDLHQEYVHLTTWPPSVTVTSTDSMQCSAGGGQTTAQGETVNETINGNEYCITTQSEGAAGSIYTTYTYSTVVEHNEVTVKFTVRLPQCMNYDDPQQSACILEQEEFNPDTVVTDIVSSLTFVE